MKYSLQFELSGVPPTANQIISRHWRFRHKTYKLWKSMVWTKTRGKLPETPLSRAQVRLTRHSSRALDPDNLAMSFKPVMDGLVLSGVLIDDNSDVVEVEYLYEKAPQKKAKISVEVVAAPTGIEPAPL